MSFTVGIVTYERPTLLSNTLDSLIEQMEYPEKVVVIDDGVDTAVRDVAAEYRDRFNERDVDMQYIHRSEGGTMQSARNRVIEEATTEHVAFVDDDTWCHRRWLATLSESFDSLDITGIGGPAIRVDDDREPTDDIIRSADILNELNEYGEVVDASGRWIPPEPVEVDVFRGANMVFERSALLEVGGFDGGYLGPEIFEEWDVMYKLKQNGHTLLYHPNARVDHFETDTGGSRARLEQRNEDAYWFALNSILFKKQHAEDRFWRAMWRLLYAGTDDNLPTVTGRITRLLLQGERRHIPWLSGYFSGLRSDT